MSLSIIHPYLCRISFIGFADVKTNINLKNRFKFAYVKKNV